MRPTKLDPYIVAINKYELYSLPSGAQRGNLQCAAVTTRSIQPRTPAPSLPSRPTAPPSYQLTSPEDEDLRPLQQADSFQEVARNMALPQGAPDVQLPLDATGQRAEDPDSSRFPLEPSAVAGNPAQWLARRSTLRRAPTSRASGLLEEN